MPEPETQNNEKTPNEWWSGVDTIQIVLYLFEVLLSSYPIVVNFIAWTRHDVEILDSSEPFLISSFIIMSYTTLVLITTFRQESASFTLDAWAFFIWGATFLYDVTLAILLLSNKIQPHENNHLPIGLFIATVILSFVFRYGYIWRNGHHDPDVQVKTPPTESHVHDHAP